MTETESNPTGWRTQATAWELLAFTFRYPGPELAEAAASASGPTPPARWRRPSRSICRRAGARV